MNINITEINLLFPLSVSYVGDEKDFK